MLYKLWSYIYNLYTTTVNTLSSLTTTTFKPFSVTSFYAFLITLPLKTKNPSKGLSLVSHPVVSTDTYTITRWLLLSRDVLISFYQTYLIHQVNQILVRFLGVGLFYLYYSTFIMYIDACLTDDEPIWEPIE